MICILNKPILLLRSFYSCESQSNKYNFEVKRMSDIMNKTFGEQSGNAKKHLDTVEILCRDTLQTHQIFRDDLKKLSEDLLILRQRVKKNPHELKKFLVDKLTPVRDTLTYAEQSQRHDNKDMQELMTQIKRENRETCEAIVKTFDKLKYLEKKIGQYS